MPKCFASVIARQWITSLLAARASNRIERPAACQIGPFVTDAACPRLILRVAHKKFMTAATRLRLLDAATFSGRQEPSLSADKN
jgi:hypothetical protein